MRRLLLLLLVLPLLAAAPAHADEPRSWRGLDVPYLSGGRVHFQGSAFRLMDDPDLAVDLVTLGATRRAAILQLEEELVVALPAGGRQVVPLTRRAVGIPMPEPDGDWVFWTDARRGHGGRLVGYDTRRGIERRGPAVGRAVRVMAVEGRTAYVLTRRGYAAWTPGRGLRRLPGHLTDFLLTDVDRGRFVLADLAYDAGGVRVVTADGTVEAELPDAISDTFDPSGRFLDLGPTSAVWDARTGEVVPLRMGPRWSAYATSWAPSGELVVVAQDTRPDRQERNPARRFACRPATGACERLPDPRGVRHYRVEHEPYDASALTQLGVLVGS